MSPIAKVRHAGVAAGLGNYHRRLASDNPSYPTKLAPDQAKIIDASRRFRRAPARRSPVLTVQIGVRTATLPHGRSRPFALSVDALDRLLDTAAQLERWLMTTHLRSCAVGVGGDVSGISISARPPAEKNTLRGFFDIELASGLILRGCTLHEKNGRRWVGLPAKPYATDTGAQGWAAIVDFRDKRTAARFQELATPAAVVAYERGGQ